MNQPESNPDPATITENLSKVVPLAEKIFRDAYQTVVPDDCPPSVVIRSEGKDPVRVFLSKLTTVGRSRTCEIRLPDSGVSRTHCLLKYEPESQQVWLTDLDSRNGTWLNGQAIREPRVLRAGDLVQLGRFAGFWYFPAGAHPKSDIPPQGDPS